MVHLLVTPFLILSSSPSSPSSFHFTLNSLICSPSLKSLYQQTKKQIFILLLSRNDFFSSLSFNFISFLFFCVFFFSIFLNFLFVIANKRVSLFFLYVITELFYQQGLFLVECTRLYTPLCPSIRPSVCRSICRLIHHTLIFLLISFR